MVRMADPLDATLGPFGSSGVIAAPERGMAGLGRGADEAARAHRNFQRSRKPRPGGP